MITLLGWDGDVGNEIGDTHRRVLSYCKYDCKKPFYPSLKNRIFCESKKSLKKGIKTNDLFS